MRRAVTTCLLAFVWAAGSAGQTAGDRDGSTIFEGARLITGDGRPVIEDSTFVIAKGTFIAVGQKGQVKTAAGARRVSLTGKTVMPAIVDGHVHLGYRKGLTFSADNYTRETLLDTLDRFALLRSLRGARGGDRSRLVAVHGPARGYERRPVPDCRQWLCHAQRRTGRPDARCRQRRDQ